MSVNFFLVEKHFKKEQVASFVTEDFVRVKNTGSLINWTLIQQVQPNI